MASGVSREADESCLEGGPGGMLICCGQALETSISPGEGRGGAAAGTLLYHSV